MWWARSETLLWLSSCPKSFKVKIGFSTIASQLLSFLDVIGVILAATSVSLLISELQGSSVTETSAKLFSILGIDQLDFRGKFIVIGLLSFVFLITKSTASALITFYNFRLLAREAVRVEDLLTKYVLSKRDYASNRKDGVHKLIYGLSNGVENLIVVRFGSQITLFMEIGNTLFLGLFFLLQEPRMALILFTAVFLIFGFLEKTINKESRILGSKLFFGLTTISQKLHEGLMMQREFLVWRIDNPKISEALPLRQDLAQTKAKATILPNISKNLIEITFALLAIIISFVAIFSTDAKSGIESVILLFLISSRIIPALLRAQNALVSIKNIQGSSEITLTLLREEATTKDLLAKHFHSSRGIIVENISLSYPDSKQVVVENVSFKLEKGDIVGVVGKTGAGKSSLINAILGLSKPKTGRINLPNTADKKSNGQTWSVSYVPQDAFIFAGTIRENILCGRKFSDSEIQHVLSIAKFEITNVKESELLNYQLELGGGNLSGGEKQRIAIARAILGKPAFLVLDEATSALDLKTEQEVLKNILKYMVKESILLLVSHRLDTLKLANRFLCIKNGKVYDLRKLSDVKRKILKPSR